MSTVIAASTAGCDLDGPRNPADRVFIGGPIVTVNDTQPEVAAVAVRDGRIFAIGSEAEIELLTDDDTEVTDLAGRTLVPGLVDAHVHPAVLGGQAVGANLLAPPDGDVETIDDLVASLRAAAGGPGEQRTGWIFGLGYDDAVLAEGRHPTRDDLDRVSTDVPVIAIHISGHIAAVNSLGLETIGYSADTEDPEGGLIRRWPGSREPNGVLEEFAAIPNLFPILIAQIIGPDRGAGQRFEEDPKGSIREGNPADLVILSENPLTIDLERIDELVVLETIKGGRTVWRRDRSATVGSAVP